MGYHLFKIIHPSHLYTVVPVPVFFLLNPQVLFYVICKNNLSGTTEHDPMTFCLIPNVDGQ